MNKYEKRLNKIANDLTKLINDFREEYQNGICYVEGEGVIYLLKKDPVTNIVDRKKEIVASSKYIPNMDCGGW